MDRYDQRIHRGQTMYPDKFDPSELEAVDPAIRKAYNDRSRVKVTATYDDGETWTRTGTIGCTTGWRPAFLLMARVDSHGSSDVLGVRDRVVAVKMGRYYVKRHEGATL